MSASTPRAAVVFFLFLAAFAAGAEGQSVTPAGAVARPAASAPPGNPAGPQAGDTSSLAGLRWRALGPAIAGGRVTDIEVVPGGSSHLYLGAASGGVWKTVNHGTTWEPTLDEAVNLSVGDIALAPSDPLEVWVGTGEANNRNSSPWGQGVYHSTDGGKTWTHEGLDETRHIGRILVHPTDPATVWVAALGHLFGPNEERGLYKSTDAGETWRKVLHVDENTGVVDLVMDPADPSILYAASYQRRRRAWGFNGGGPGSGVWKSTDGGETWRELTRGLPEGDKGRIGLALWPRDPRRVYAVVEADSGGVFRSDDRGESWRRLNELNPRPMYYSQLRVDPNDDRVLYVLGTRLHRSVDGGETFEEMPIEAGFMMGVHADQHDLWIDPRDSDHLLLGNDGGFYVSYDRGESWLFRPNLPIQQFYDVDLDDADPYHVWGGLQDNNSYRGPSATRRIRGVMNRDWQVVDYGDGMYAQADDEEPRVGYTASQGGALIRVWVPTGDRKDVQPMSQDDDEEYRFDWKSPVLVSPHDRRKVLLGGNRLFISPDMGTSWRATADLSKQIHQDSLEIMGVLPDSATLSKHDGVSGYGEIVSLAESPVTPGVLWAGLDDGNLQVSRDDGRTWTEVSEAVGLPRPTYVSWIEASAFAEERAYVGFDGHWDDDYRPFLYVTEDFGGSWRPLHGGLASATVNVVREHPDNEDLLFVGAEDGVLVSLDRGVTWARLNNNMPRVPVDDLEIQRRENDLVAGTHGRGIWILDDVSALSGMTEAVRAAPAHLFELRPATLFQYRNDVPNVGQGVFAGPNPEFGAVLDYRLSETRPDGVRLHVRANDGTPVRTLEGPGRRGVNRVTWDLRHEPIPHDTTVFDPPSLDVGPRGPFVPAGRYTVELEGASPTRTVEVRWDPLHPVPAEEQRARYAFGMEMYGLGQTGYHAAVQVARVLEPLQARLDSLEVLLGEGAGDEVAREEGPGEEGAREEDDPDLERARELVERVEAASDSLAQRNGDLRGWWRGLAGDFLGGPSTIGSMTGPTETQRARLEHLEETFARDVGRIESALDEAVPELNRLLQDHDLEAVEVPPRGSGPGVRPVPVGRP